MQLGLSWESVRQHETFKFGAGEPVVSHQAMLYPVYSHGTQSWVRISEVGEGARGCPGLIGPSEMTRWDVELRFGTRTMKVLGQARPMRLSNTRHPVLQLLEMDADHPWQMQTWYQGELGTLVRRLREDPAQMAFFEDETVSPTSTAAPEEEGSEGEIPILDEAPPQEVPTLTSQDLAELQGRLAQDVELSYGLLQTAFKDRDPEAEESSSFGSISEPVSETSHELGAPQSEPDSDTSSEAADNRERHETLYAPELQPYTKGQKRRVLNAASQILISQDYGRQAEKERRMASKIKTPRIPRPMRRLGLKILELFTWSCLVSRIAYTQGWQFCEPVTLPHWDITNPVDFEQALHYIEREDPDLLIIAWPCTKWSSFQRLATKTAVQKAALEEERREQRRTFLSLSGRAASLQRQRKKAVLGENPATSLAWDQPEIALSFAGLASVQCDQCQYGLKHPETGEPLRKRTKFMGQPTVVKYLTRRCPGDHQHGQIEGSVHIDDMSVSLATWCGAYPPDLCRAILKGATEYLMELESQDHEEESGGYFHEVLAEESLMDGPEVIDEQEEMRVEEPEDDPRPRQEENPEQRFPVAAEIRAAVERAHRSLGHPSRPTLIRMLRVAGAVPAAIEYAQKWKCDVCQARAVPKQPTASAPGHRPYGFNKYHQVDLKYCRDARGQKYVFMSMIDCGTGYHQATMVKTRQSGYCATKWHKHWVAHYGAPQRVWHDQGGEFEQGFAALLEDLSVASTVTGSHAGWQLSFAERHGGLLDLILGAVIREHSVEGYSEMKLALSVAVQAKNATITKDGYTPAQRVFGHELRLPSLLEEEQDALSFAEALGADGEVARAHKMRMTARMAMLRNDVQERLRRAVLRKPHKSHVEFPPGCRIYFWSPAKARRRYVPGVWHGPATVLCKESHNRFFVSWRGRCLLLARENMRLASAEELALNEPANADLRELSRSLRDPETNRGYQDGTLDRPPPPPPAITAGQLELKMRGQAMLRGLKSAKRLMLEVPQPQRPWRKRKMLQDQRQGELPAPAAPEEPPRQRPRIPALGDRPAGIYAPGSAEVPEIPAHEVPIDDPDFDAEFREEVAQRIQAIPGRGSQDARSQAMEDLPFSLKKRQTPATPHQPTESVPKRIRTAFAYALTATTLEKERQNEWLSRHELALLRQLTGLEITAARMHYAPRKRLQPPPQAKKRARTSILIGRDPSMTLVIEENASEVQQKPKKKTAFDWKGLTMFHKQMDTRDRLRPGFLELPEGLARVYMTQGDWNSFHDLWKEEVCDCLVADALYLKLKENKKELDSRFFDAEEREAFKGSDKKEWQQWIDHKVVRFLTPDEARRVPKNQIIRSPMRIVRTNKAADRLSPLVAKSRIVILGRMDPEVGQHRTDSPTASVMSTRLLKQIAVSRNWSVFSFDVSTAFLRGKSLDRKLYVRAPTDGLPATDSTPPVRPLELMQVLKSAYGLTESPRLWYLEARETLEASALEELAASRSTFVASEKGTSYALCALHVDDGLLAGDEKDERFQAVKKGVNDRFQIKKWNYLTEKDKITFLGVDLHKETSGITDRMDKYIREIDTPEKVPKGPLDEAGRSAFRRLVMRLRWPAQHCVPHFLYPVSWLAQKVTTASGEDMNQAINLLVAMKEEALQGRARLWYQQIPEDKLVVLTLFDASLGKEEAGKSQLAAAHFIAHEDTLKGPAAASLMDFTTNKSSRVVRSSMAAEACAMCLAADRHLYMRLVLHLMLTGLQQIPEQWRKKLAIRGYLVTDAKSLYDHMVRTHHMPTERQTLLDVLVCKDLVENGVVTMKWVPTFKQYADAMTKAMRATLWEDFFRTGVVSLKETPTEAKEEEHRRGLRQAQRQRRKVRMKQISGSAK